MTINSVSLISGALSFSAALAWNKAISETLSSVTDKASSPLAQAIIITIIIIILVFIINISIELYINTTNTDIKPSVRRAGSNNNAKVKLWNF